MSVEATIEEMLLAKPSRWLVTGAAGFIGSHLVERLLRLGQTVVGLDNFSTGHHSNLLDIESRVAAGQWEKFSFIEGDICHLDDCHLAAESVDYVLHQAALGSVPRSIADPIATNQANVDGFLNMLVASRDARVKRFVYAASSSTYGDHPGLPKVEEQIGKPLSPYAVTKYVNELYADVFYTTYGLQTIGLRYFNVFGPRQDPQGAYAAVIPRWFEELLEGKQSQINGDGETSRDFCYIENTVQANILAATTHNESAINQIYNVAVGDRTSLNQLFFGIRELIATAVPQVTNMEPAYGDFRAGDVRHSQADISKAEKMLGYSPKFTALQGLALTADWFLNSFHKDTNEQ
jgi:UDP-N-acetylglucosamine 4-epimerase